MLETIYKQRSGFTLVELLAVMAVITILVAVVVPATIQVRNRGREVACLANLRQLGGAVASYSSVWNDRLPTLTSSSFAYGNPTAQWPAGSSATEMREVVSPHIRSGRVFKCGNDSGAPEYGFSATGGSVFCRSGSSYLPWSAARPGRYGLAINGARTSGFGSSAACVLLRDYGSDWHGFRNRNGLGLRACSVANAVFADGHTTTIPTAVVGTSERDYACWIAKARGAADSVFIAGGSEDIQAELTGRRIITDEEQAKFMLSGSVSAGGTVRDVDRVFAFAAGISDEAALRQIVNWIESLVAG